ncbi:MULTISPECIES: hypothetical protein [unclassified Thermosynechococcus]|uniref:hypothetical protein n=1 Tax=unclassified Thermosynechococcus TaxID=2622553 RepID=UPI001981D156|nr:MULTISPECIES: hypothetical protein [unclassified Thermosynechococcus]MDR7898931.1 hypothetical protein [Thermosynechococcus sp. JY1332]MDR7906336.1 hypothetical protein [Thermosynechococcus sp. JY1334]MDR7921276.1 hypothetical protein [Thermosynechococcus sp. HY213]QSF50004.1 hypothetical protein JW907_04435 [Thermosynechococcus sp. TA-1]WKT86056.1 hypothetical protein QYC30_11500 [Thermosynechococcus sp. JY1339]
MPIQLSKRRECGGTWVVDVDLGRSPTNEELTTLAQRHGGRCRQFQQLVWLDFPSGRITASLRLSRLTIRLGDNALEAAIIAELQQLAAASVPACAMDA